MPSFPHGECDDLGKSAGWMDFTIGHCKKGIIQGCFFSSLLEQS